MSNTKKSYRWLPTLTAGLLSGLPQAALAAVNVQQYSPAGNSTYTMTEDAMLEVAPKDPTWTGSRLFFSANYNWLNDALIQYNAARTQREATLVDGVQSLDLGVGWMPVRSLSLNFATSLNMVHMPASANQFALGDSRAFVKWRLTADDSVVAVSIIPEIRLPTGNQSLFLSDGEVGYGASLAIEHDFGPVRASANIGYRYSPNATFMDIDYTQRLPMALGVYIPVAPKWAILGEAAGAVVLPINPYQNPNELYGGARYQFNRDLAFFGGLSLGRVGSEAGNDVRISTGIRFSPMPDERIVEVPKSIPAQVAQIAPPPAPKPAPKKKRVIFTPKEIKISEEIKFKHDSAVLTDSGKELLDEVAHVIKKNRKAFKKIRIEGHTNELGSYPYNQRLSEQRAAAVREYLASRGISGKELASMGYGKTRPKPASVLKGLSRDARLAANRRVEFKVIN